MSNRDDRERSEGGAQHPQGARDESRRRAIQAMEGIAKGERSVEEGVSRDAVRRAAEEAIDRLATLTEG